MTQDAWLDKAKEIREGEEFDIVKLEQYLKDQLNDFQGPLVVEQFPSGYSNLTYLLRDNDKQWVLRRPPRGAKKIKKGHDMGREYRILSRLKDVYPKVPTPIIHCEDEDILGAEFYIMERVEGIILRHKAPKGLALPPERMRSLSELLVDTMVDLHGIDIHASGLDDIGKPEGYIERQVKGWTERYKASQTDEIPEMERVAKWLAENMPEEQAPSSIHNDYKFDNIVFDPSLERSIAVLDWEMATVGDPLMDLGTTLGYWVTSNDPEEWKMLPFGASLLPGNLSRNEIVARYAEKSGRDVSNILFYYANALFKIAVVLQQIYFRYKQGDTKDERFANFVMGVYMLSQIASTAIDKDRIEPLA